MKQKGTALEFGWILRGVNTDQQHETRRFNRGEVKAAMYDGSGSWLDYDLF